MIPTLVAPDVLVVEDDPDIGALLDRGLVAAGFGVQWVDTADDALRHVALHGPKAVLLDVTLPDGTGYDVCRSLRQKGYSGTIVFLSAKDEVSDRVDGLAAGGDDYIVKPFAFGELVARLRAQLPRRAAASGGSDLCETGGLSLDRETRQARFADVVVKLTQREVDLLSLFMEQPNRPIARGTNLRTPLARSGRLPQRGRRLHRLPARQARRYRQGWRPNDRDRPRARFHVGVRTMIVP